jgi:hypothetical protein
MSIDTVFKPQWPNSFVGTAGVQLSAMANGTGITSFRVRNLAAVVQYFGWGSTAAQAVANATATPAAGLPVQNNIGMLPSTVETFEIPGNMFFAAATTTGFEFCGGQGS